MPNIVISKAMKRINWRCNQTVTRCVNLSNYYYAKIQKIVKVNKTNDKNWMILVQRIFVAGRDDIWWESFVTETGSMTSDENPGSMRCWRVHSSRVQSNPHQASGMLSQNRKSGFKRREQIFIVKANLVLDEMRLSSSRALPKIKSGCVTSGVSIGVVSMTVKNCSPANL